MGGLFVLRAGQVFDGERLIGRAAVMLEDGRVADVDTTGAPPPLTASVLDFGSDSFLMPGLIDAHVHLSLGATADIVGPLLAADDASLLASMRAAAERALSAGVTTVRDLGDRGFLSLALRERGPRSGLPEILASGPPLTPPGGHCHYLGGEAAGEVELHRAVRERAERGCEFVKVMVSGGGSGRACPAYESQYDLAALRRIVEEAHRAGCRTAAHVHGPGAIADSLSAGFDSLEHVTFLTTGGVDADAALVERVAASGGAATVTVTSRPPGPSSGSPGCAEIERAILENHGRLWRAGARLVPGSDAGVSPDRPHDVLPSCLSTLVGGIGMIPEDALRAATSVAAKSLGLAGRKGRIVRGADADVLVVRGDPMSDLCAVRDVVAVFRDGVRAR